jgi:hypothetical protein
VVIVAGIFNGQGIEPEPLDWVLLRVVLGDPERFEFLRKKQVAKSCGIGWEAVTVACFNGLFPMDLVDPVASVVAATCPTGYVVVRVASASVVAATTSSSADAVR